MSIKTSPAQFRKFGKSSESLGIGFIVDGVALGMQRKTIRKLVLFFRLAILGGLLILIGCAQPRDKPAESTPQAFEGQLIKVSCPRPELVTLMNRQGSLWAKGAGARVQAISAQDPDQPQRIADASVWLIRPADLPHIVSLNQLLPVPADSTKTASLDGWNSLLPLYREKLLTWSGQAYAVPVLGDAHVCIYRADLLSVADHRRRFHAKYGHELDPPQTWEDYAQIAEYFTDHRESGKRIPSLLPLPVSDEELDYLFFAVAAPHDRRAVYQDDRKRPKDDELFSFHYDIASSRARIDGPAFVYALKLLQRLQAFRPAASLANPISAFSEGQAVLCLAEPSAIAHIRKRLPPSAIGVCSVPGSARCFAFRDGLEKPAPAGGNHVPYQGAGGWLAVVPQSAPHPQAAFAFLAELGSRGTSAQIVFDPEVGGGVYRQDQLDSDREWFSFELNAAQTANLKQALQQTLARPGLLNPVVCLRTPDQLPHRHALDEQIRFALVQGTDAQQALQNAVKRWKELDAEKDADTRKKEYLLSLGLTP
jgi:multiple sugar transport system substrate-binding protein